MECLPQLLHDLLKFGRLRRQRLGTQFPDSVWGRTGVHEEPDLCGDSSEQDRGTISRNQCSWSGRVPESVLSSSPYRRIPCSDGEAITQDVVTLLHYSRSRGGMCEWLKQAVLKTAVRETVPGVRIPLPPPAISLIHSGFHPLRLRRNDSFNQSGEQSGEQGEGTRSKIPFPHKSRTIAFTPANSPLGCADNSSRATYNSSST